MSDGHGTVSELQQRRERSLAATILECGDGALLWHRGHVAIELLWRTGRAGGPLLARAMDAPLSFCHSRWFDGDNSPGESGDRSPHSKVVAV